MEQLKHECGVAMIRLLKPLEYYERKYGTLVGDASQRHNPDDASQRHNPEAASQRHNSEAASQRHNPGAYGFNKLYLMMEKQHNRGQEGAGIASVSLNKEPGTEYMFRERAEGKDAITEIFSRVTEEMAGELLMGHLRYSTTGKSGLTFVHPFLRRNNWRAKNLCLCGNFNMTNIDEVFQFLTDQGQSPRIYGDSYITLELMGHRLDREVERLFEEAKAKGLEGIDITRYIDDNVKMTNVLRTTMSHFDGGYVMCGLTGSGEMFAVRDPWGIRPAFYYRDEEIVALASERPVIQTTFDLQTDDIQELQPGQALIVRKNGEIHLEQIVGHASQRDEWSMVRSALPLGSSKNGQRSMANSACSFERIYFSRGSDRDIYQERKRLGEQLTPAILKAIDGDVENTVFSYIPNTAEVAYYGMTDGFRQQGYNVRTEKVIWKDIKLRTFIADNSERNDLAAHVYDISYGSLRPYKDNLVIIDDSIVRGTTLRESIFKILDRLHPKKIVMVSSSPQIRYPDYYGIDIARLEEFCAFRATIALIEESHAQTMVNGQCSMVNGQCSMVNNPIPHLLQEVYNTCKEHPLEANHVKRIYEPFTVEKINAKIVEMLRPEGMQAPVELVFQSIEGLHHACPNHKGDWYFTGHYPTPGGTRLCNQAFVNWYENSPSPLCGTPRESSCTSPGTES